MHEPFEPHERRLILMLVATFLGICIMIFTSQYRDLNPLPKRAPHVTVGTR